MSPLFPTGLLLGGALLAAAPGRVGAAAALLAPLAAAAALPAGPATPRLFALAFCAAAFLAALYGLGTARRDERAAGLTLAAGACGVAQAPDWVALFFCWELMAVAGLAVTWAGGPAARGAGLRYILLHTLGGGLLLAGLLLHGQAGGGLAVEPFVAPGTPLTAAATLVLAAALINAATPPLHAWLPDAYPRCTPVGSVIQSAFTTKAAVVLLLRVFPGTDVLVVIGAGMALYGVLFALLEDDVRRLLAYHIVCQVGYMLAGVGMGTALALNGAATLAVSNILYKALLLMGAGALVHAAGTGRLSSLGGLWSGNRAVFFLYMAGALAISGAPPFNGFISKSLVIAASQSDAPKWAATLLHLASVGTFLSVGLKIPYFAFFGPNRAAASREVPWEMKAAMALAAAACLGTGLFPDWLYDRLSEPVFFKPYAASLVLGSLGLLAGAGAVFWPLRGALRPAATWTLDADRLYRTPTRAVVFGAARAATALGAAMAAAGGALASRAVASALAPRTRPALVGGPLTWLAAVFALAALAGAARP